MSAKGGERLPVDLITGFLGSGKTSLINAVLRDPAFAGTLVIVNEFGAVGLDHLLVSSADDQVVLLDSGCLCCASSGTLRDTLIDIFARRSSGAIPSFDRIVVETSGLAHPAPMVAALLGDSALTPRCQLAQVLTLVDAANGAHSLREYAEARRQVAFADRLVISKTDTADELAISGLRQQLGELNPQAPISQWCLGQPCSPWFAAEPSRAPVLRTTAAWLRGPLRPQYADGRQEADAHGGAFGRISTHVLQLPGVLDWASYAALTQALSARLGRRLLRCKGLLALGEAADIRVVQGVQGYFAAPSPWSPSAAAPATGFLVCIGESITRSELEAIATTICSSFQPTFESLSS